jgi:hypothetical protein
MGDILRPGAVTPYFTADGERRTVRAIRGEMPNSPRVRRTELQHPSLGRRTNNPSDKPMRKDRGSQS